MGTNTLTDVVSGTILPSHVNDIHAALSEDFVPRNSSGVPTNEAGSLGTPTIQWAAIRAKRFLQDGVEFGQEVELDSTNQVISGAIRSTSNQPAFMVPSGSGATGTIEGTPTNLVYNVNGTEVTSSADIALSGLTLAPNTNNTALVNDTGAADQESTRTWGEELSEKGEITIDTVGTEISNRVGEYHAFKINDGANDEYFLAFIKSATELSNIMRGYFYDSSINPVNRITFANNDTITFMSTAWVFLADDGLTDGISYNPPVWSADEPSSPVTDDRWFDITNDRWKRYNGTIFVTSNEILVGILVLDDTNCVAARSVEFASNPGRENTMLLELDSVTVVKAQQANSTISIDNKIFNFAFSFPEWDITTDLAASADMYDATEQSSRTYFMYIKDTGDTVISDVHPYYRRDKFGFYHPHNPWRCVGYAKNDGSSDLEFAGDFPGDCSDEETDSFTNDTDSSQTVNTGSGWVTLTLGSDNSKFGHAITRSSNTYTFTKRGRYEVIVKAALDGDGGAAGFKFRVRNTTDSITLFEHQSFINVGDAEEYVTSHMEFDITNLDASYEIQGDSTTTNVLMRSKHYTVRRFKGPHIGSN